MISICAFSLFRHHGVPGGAAAIVDAVVKGSNRLIDRWVFLHRNLPYVALFFICVCTLFGAID